MNDETKKSDPVQEYLDDYELRLDEGCYAPNERELFLIEDAMQGYESETIAELRDHLEAMTNAASGCAEEAAELRAEVAGLKKALANAHTCHPAIKIAEQQRKAIKDAPHDANCPLGKGWFIFQHPYYSTAGKTRYDKQECDCWKHKALEGE